MHSLAEILLDIVKILLPLAVISFVSLFISKTFEIKNISDKFLALFLLNWGQIVISIQILSIFSVTNIWALSIFHMLSLFACILIASIKKISFKLDFHGIKYWWLNLFKASKFEKIITIIIVTWLLIIIAVTFFEGIIALSGNWDSMAYHLPRAGFWKQHQTINHYFTHYAHHNDYPVISSVGILWIMIFTNSDILAYMIQWVSLIAILLCFYKLLRLLRFSRIISLITVFIFSTFDMVILQGYTTQNDLVITGFIILALYFLIKFFNEHKFFVGYLLLTGFAVGLAIGSKGYSYLFVPGFIIFIFLYLKLTNQKYRRGFYVILFSIVGIVLFASYNLILNYMSFGNIFGSPDLVTEMRMEVFGIKPFVSNFSRHLISFYQGLPGLEGFSNFIRESIIQLHDKINFDISSRATTLTNIYWVLWDMRIDFDVSYFGPVFFFFGLPAIIYNSLLILILKPFKKDRKLILKYKNSILVSIISIVFFIGYVFMFKWHIFAGRYMIAFVLLLMVNVAVFLEITNKVRKKAFFYIIALVLVLVSLGFSTMPLFRNDYRMLIDFEGNNFINKLKQEETADPKSVPDLNKAIKRRIDKIFGPGASLGLILDRGDWVYVYFGKNFKNKLFYIPQDEWNKKEVKEIIDSNSFDALIINKEAPVFKNNQFEHLLDKFKGRTLLEVDNSNFNDYVEPGNCNLMKLEKGIFIEARNDDPNITLSFPSSASPGSFLILIEIESDYNAMTQVYFGYKGQGYSEEDSESFELVTGKNSIPVIISEFDNLEKIRIDPINLEQDVIIEKIGIYEYQKDVITEEIGHYILVYN